MRQLDANLSEGEPYYRLARKNKRRQNVAQRDIIQIYQKCGKPVLKTRQDKQHQCGARYGAVDQKICGKIITEFTVAITIQMEFLQI